MADDIASPLLLCPNFDTLFVIDQFDNAYSPDGTFKGQKRIITDALVNGYTKLLMSNTQDIIQHPVHIGKATIISDSSVNDELNGGIWTLKFDWNGKIRTLIRYELNAGHDIWPAEITQISHIIVIGSMDWNSIVKYYVHVDSDKVGSNPNIEPDPRRSGMYHIYMPQLTLQFRHMIETRTKLPFTWTQLAYSSDKMQSYDMIPNGRGSHTMIHYCDKSINTASAGFICIDENVCNTSVSRGWEHIGQVIIESFKDDWYTKYSRYAT